MVCEGGKKDRQAVLVALRRGWLEIRNEFTTAPERIFAFDVGSIEGPGYKGDDGATERDARVGHGWSSLR